jgi:3-phosphoshikimate 1-carboxyvinyltransferase
LRIRSLLASSQPAPTSATEEDAPAGARLDIPGDPSSAAFLLAGALLVPGGAVRVEGVSLNPTRLGWLEVLRRMGADVGADASGEVAGEPVGTLFARGGPPLTATRIEAAEVPSLVDEIPLLAAVATQAQGTPSIRGAGELRVKESDRLAAIAAGLRALGAQVEELPDGLDIRGPTPLRGATVQAQRDHRIAMSLAVAALVAEGPTRIAGAEWADISFPSFFPLLAQLAGR